MNVVVCRLSLRFPENDTIKGKRRTIKSLCSRVRNKFNVSISEVGDNDLWKTSILGIVCVSKDNRHAHSVLSAVLDYVQDMSLDLEILDYSIENVYGF